MTRIALSEMGYVRYNANKDDKQKGDCTIRALSLAYNIPYEKVSREFRGHSRGETYQFNTRPNIEWFIKEHGYEGDEVFTPIEDSDMREGPVPTVEEFVDAHPTGTYLLLTGKGWMFGDNYSHIVCCIDGDIYDSWDSGKHYVKYICTVDSSSDTSIVTDRYTEDEIKDYVIYTLDQAVHDYLLPYDTKEFVLLKYRGINPEDNTILMYPDFRAFRMPSTSCFFVHMRDKYTCSISVYMNTQAAKDLYGTLFRAKISVDCHNKQIILKFSPKMTNDEIDQIIEKKIVSEIKKLKKLLAKEQELCNQVEQGDMWSEFPLLDLNKLRNSAISETKVYDLLKNCKDDIKKRVLRVEWSYWAKRWMVYIKALPKDERNNNYMIVSEKGMVELDGKNAKQINKCYDQYLADVISYDSGDHYYSYDQL